MLADDLSTVDTLISLTDVNGTSIDIRRASSSSPRELVTTGASLFFSGVGKTDPVAPSTGRELYIRGATGAANLVRDIRTGQLGSDPEQLVAVDGQVYFEATTNFGSELWASDGTAANTRLVRDIALGADQFQPDRHHRVRRASAVHRRR